MKLSSNRTRRARVTFTNTMQYHTPDYVRVVVDGVGGRSTVNCVAVVACPNSMFTYDLRNLKPDYSILRQMHDQNIGIKVNGKYMYALRAYNEDGHNYRIPLVKQSAYERYKNSANTPDTAPFACRRLDRARDVLDSSRAARLQYERDSVASRTKRRNRKLRRLPNSTNPVEQG